MTRQEPWIIYTIAYKSAQRAHQSPVSCREKDVDRYGRIVATCQVRGEDIELWLVRSGHAFAYRRYSSDYMSRHVGRTYSSTLGMAQRATPFVSIACAKCAVAVRSVPKQQHHAAQYLGDDNGCDHGVRNRGADHARNSGPQG
ncbi:MAG: hypothetical protein FD139_3724 [Methylocystaceae bacterium]|nr:MAG: hypothetical protein FD139_3724 [Methylocystaceae bacterium]